STEWNGGPIAAGPFASYLSDGILERSSMENQGAGAKDGTAAELNGVVSKPTPPVDETVQKILDKALYAGGRPEAQKLRNFLNGTWLGEPLHVVLTDLPVGAWTVAMVFDLLGLGLDRREFAKAADT